MTPIGPARKIELSHEILTLLSGRGITIGDRVDIIEIVMNSLLAKKRQYDRRKK